MQKRFCALATAAALCVSSTRLGAQTTAPARNAADLYIQAEENLLKQNPDLCSPASSNDIYPAYPPFGPAWDAREKIAFAADAQARDLIHQAASIDHAEWPVTWSKAEGPTQAKVMRLLPYLNGARWCANEVGDAALYEHLQGNDRAAIDGIGDLLHLARAIDGGNDKFVINLLVATGIDALAANRLMIIESTIHLSQSPGDGPSFSAEAARALIQQLLVRPDPASAVDAALSAEGASRNPIAGPALARATETVRRVNGEMTLAAMSMACHLYQLDHGRWPANLDELRAELPAGVDLIDPWGDGKQTFGYVLLPGGLPDGSDRPLVYSRNMSKDGLFYRMDEPEYGFYLGDGTRAPPAKQKQGGQFRDVAGWAPVGPKPEQTTQPVDGD